MKIEYTGIEGLCLLTPKVFQDERGYFFESYSSKNFPNPNGCLWVQDNESKSIRGVLRGLHYQAGEMAQAKLVRVISGAIFDVAVDLRTQSPTYGQWFGIVLDDVKKQQLYIPRGLAHGFLVLSESAIFAYKCDNFYSPEHEGGICYNDKKLNIDWPIQMDEIILSKKDAVLPLFGHHKPVE